MSDFDVQFVDKDGNTLPPGPTRIVAIEWDADFTTATITCTGEDGGAMDGTITFV